MEKRGANTTEREICQFYVFVVDPENVFGGVWAMFKHIETRGIQEKLPGPTLSIAYVLTSPTLHLTK